MQLIELVCKDKRLNFKYHSRQYFEIVSDNADYVVNIDIQDERQNAMFLRIVFPDKSWRELAIPADGNVELPLWALQFRLLDIGVTSGDIYATLPTKIAVKGSIKAICGEDQIEIPEQSVVDQIINLVNGIVTPTVEVNTNTDNVYTLDITDKNGTITTPNLRGGSGGGGGGGGANFTTDETLTYVNNVLSVNTTNDAEHDNTLPITSAGVYTQIGNITALLETI